MSPCCENLENREDGPGPRGGDAPEGVAVTHCTVCGCRHFEAEADAGVLGVKGESL
jgi:hypothetical protein